MSTPEPNPPNAPRTSYTHPENCGCHHCLPGSNLTPPAVEKAATEGGTPRTDDEEAKYRAEWLEKHGAHKDWVVLRESEVAAIRRELDQLTSIQKSANAHHGSDRKKLIVPDDPASRATYWKARAQASEGQLATALRDKEADGQFIAFVRNKCRVVYLQSMGDYPLEHDPHTKNGMWQAICDAARSAKGDAT